VNDGHEQVALRFLHAMGDGDSAAVADCLAPDAVTMARNFAKVGGVNSREQIVAMVGSFRSLMPDGLKFSVLSVISGKDLVAIECDGDAVTSAGTVYRNQYCFTFRFDGGRIKEIHEYFCSKLADEVIWPLVQQNAS
jgi:ketosteroid isomerase-like protein